MDDYEKMLLTIFLHQLMWQESFFFVILLTYFFFGEEAFELRRDKTRISHSLIKRMPDQKMHLHNLIETSDVVCVKSFVWIVFVFVDCENAFRQGYLEVIGKELNVMFPGTDLTSTNARFKLTVWKKEYYIVLNMINTSGFGWNDSSNQIFVSDDVWEEYVKVRWRHITYQYLSFVARWVLLLKKTSCTLPTKLQQMQQ
ncbi:hypothetical protein OROMI_007987 [Orobanche minor]